MQIDLYNIEHTFLFLLSSDTYHAKDLTGLYFY